MRYLVNSFSLNMLAPGRRMLAVEPVGEEEAGPALQWANYVLDGLGGRAVIGHADLAGLVGLAPSDVRRESLTLRGGDTLYVAQYTGPRLPEGATRLPEGATLSLIRVTVGHTDEEAHAEAEDRAKAEAAAELKAKAKAEAGAGDAEDEVGLWSWTDAI